MNKVEKEIYTLISRYYHDIEKDIDTWYNTRNIFFDYKTPKEMIELGKEDKVLELIKMVTR